jgi:hypothetical protein
MRSYEIPNRQVYEYADQIAKAAEFLYEHILQVQCAPSVLLEGALAVELYLKSLSAETVLHKIEGCAALQQITAAPPKGARTHVLQDLFDVIEQPIRDELQTAYATGPAIADVLQLREALGPYNEMFVDVRYIFERQEAGNLDTNGLIELVQFFRRQIPLMQKRYHKGE